MTLTQDLRRLAVKEWVTSNNHESHFFRVVETPDYALDLELTRVGDLEVLTIHFEVHSWTSRVLREVLRDWPSVRKSIKAPLLAYVESFDPKWEKFISKFGFSYLCDARDYDETPIRLFANYS